MKSITNLTTGIVATAAVLLLGGFLASKLPASDLESTVVEGQVLADDTETSGLSVDITNVRAGEGTVIVLVFDDERAFEAYDYQYAVAYKEIAAQSGTLQAHFPELNDGPYAISLFHDENQNGDFDMNGWYPLEGYGTSGARNWYHEPTFAEASSSAGRISVRLHYP